jgi:hypothetical protein
MRTPAGAVAFNAAAVITLLLVASAALALALFLTVPRTAEPLLSLPDNTWWFIYHDPPQGGAPSALWRIGAAMATACIAAAASFRAYALFRRTGSMLFPALMLFLFSLGPECLRAGTAYLYAIDGSISAVVVLTRMIYWARFVGLLGLLLTGLYCIDFKYKRYGVLTAVIFLVSFAMAAYIPVDRTVFLTQLTWKLGDEQGVWFVSLTIGALALCTAAAAAAAKRDGRYLWLAAGLALLLVSRELLFFGANPVILGAGLAALSVGIVLCLRTVSTFSAAAAERNAD